jgi:hypothetical protein
MLANTQPAGHIRYAVTTFGDLLNRFDLELVRKSLLLAHVYLVSLLKTRLQGVYKLRGDSDLFVRNGAAVVMVPIRVSLLTVTHFAALGREQDEKATHVHNLVWDHWLAETDVSSEFIGTDHSGTIAVGSKVPRSPVGNTPSVLHAQLTNRARQLVGDEAFVTNGV